MKISVVMAVRDGQRFVKQAVQSVCAQSIQDFELIIVDDGSRDETPDILNQLQREDARIQLLRNPSPLGPFPSANRGIAVARGQFIARHDADDVSPPRRFEVQLAALESAPDVSLATGAIELFCEEGLIGVRRPPSWQPRLEWEMLFRNSIGAGGHVMFPRTVAGWRVRFAERHVYAEDYGLWSRLVRLGRVICPDAIVYRYRDHPQSISRTRKAVQSDCFRRMRDEYRAEHWPADFDQDLSAAVSSFWRMEHETPKDVRRVTAALSRLRSQFSVYVDRRYGAAAARALDAELDRALLNRFGHALFRLIRFGDMRAAASVGSLVAGRPGGWRAAMFAASGAKTAILEKLRFAPVLGWRSSDRADQSPLPGPLEHLPR